MTSRSKFVISILIAILVTAVCTGYATSFYMRYSAAAAGDRNYLTNAEFVQWNKYKRLTEVEKMIHENYYQQVDDEKLVTGAINGMLAAMGDPYSAYYTPEEYTSLMQAQQGTYAGIGVRITIGDDQLVTIVEVFEDSPALAAGLQPGDKIVQVDGADVTGMELDSVSAKIKGTIGTEVALGVKRGEESLSFSVQRQTVTLKQIAYEMLQNDIGYITIDTFNGDAKEGFLNAINTLKRDGAKGFIVDIRWNPGGHVDIVCDICDALLPAGTIVSTVTRQGVSETYKSDANYLNMPIVVLVNGSSASASEIMAGALQDYGLAKIVGNKTFGKGVVQTIWPFRSDGAGVKLTTSVYYTPNGRSLHQVGITPDYEVSLPAELEYNPSALTEQNDTQLQKGIEVLRGLIGQ